MKAKCYKMYGKLKLCGKCLNLKLFKHENECKMWKLNKTL